MEADFELDEAGSARPLPRGKGSYRIGEGRPKGFSPLKAAAMQKRMEQGEDLSGLDPESEEGRLSTTVQTNIAKARKETALAGLNELELKIKTGQYLPREAYREATATLLASLSQGLRSIPDQLERDFRLPPEVLEQIQTTIDEALNSVASELALFTETPA